MAASEDEKRESAGISSAAIDVAAVYERLKEEVRRGTPPRPVAGLPADGRGVPGRLSSLRLRLLGTAREAGAASLGRLHPERRQAHRFQVAYYSPLPPERSGVAEYSALLLPALQARLDVGVARRGGAPPVADAALYHVGNNPDAHGWIVGALRRRPGVVVLHELVLHHLVVGMTLGRGDTDGYLRALEREAGPEGRRLGRAILAGTTRPVWETEPERFPLVGEILDAATGVIVHSRYVEAGVRAAGFSGPIDRIAHPAPAPRRAEPARIDGTPVIGSFGHVNASKRVPQLLAAFGQLRRSHPDACLLLVGPAVQGFDVSRQLEHAGLAGSRAVLREEWATPDRFASLMAACDICVNLRAPTMGETSGSAVHSLALARPLVVSDIGWFAELPGDVALKVPVDEFETATLTAALELLAGDDAVRGALGERAVAYAREEHDLGRAAGAYASALGLSPLGEGHLERPAVL